MNKKINFSFYTNKNTNSSHLFLEADKGFNEDEYPICLNTSLKEGECYFHGIHKKEELNHNSELIFEKDDLIKIVSYLEKKKDASLFIVASDSENDSVSIEINYRTLSMKKEEINLIFVDTKKTTLFSLSKENFLALKNTLAKIIDSMKVSQLDYFKTLENF